MKKLKIFILLSIVTVLTVSAQENIYKLRNQFNIGVGFSNLGIPIYAGVDFGIHKDISLGLEGSFRFHNPTINGSSYNNTIIGISGNANDHFNSLFQIPRDWDFYAGANVGFYFWPSTSVYVYNNDHSLLGVGGQIGLRYFVTSRVGVNLEFGGGNAFSGGKIGITSRF